MSVKRTAVLVFLGAVAASVCWLWLTLAPDEPRAPVSREQAPMTEGARPEGAETRAEAKPAYPGARRPRPPAPESAGDPSAPVERVDFERRPWDPEKELKEIYETRARLFEMFDRFVEETGMSDERAQALLMLMYDFQETVRILDEEMASQRPYRHRWHFEFLLRKKSADWRTVMFDTDQQLDAMLSPEERKKWWRTLERAGIWLELSSTEVFGCLICPVETP